MGGCATATLPHQACPRKTRSTRARELKGCAFNPANKQEGVEPTLFSLGVEEEEEEVEEGLQCKEEGLSTRLALQNKSNSKLPVGWQQSQDFSGGGGGGEGGGGGDSLTSLVRGMRRRRTRSSRTSVKDHRNSNRQYISKIARSTPDSPTSSGGVPRLEEEG